MFLTLFLLSEMVRWLGLALSKPKKAAGAESLPKSQTEQDDLAIITSIMASKGVTGELNIRKIS